MANKQISNANKMRERLNEVGPGFCLAKWDQVGMWMGSSRSTNLMQHTAKLENK